jgi:SAM-dependent methyltransferase
MAADEPPGPARLDAAYFDQWYADIEASRARDDFVTQTLGLPPYIQSNGAVTWDAIAEIAAALSAPPDGLLLDVACGRGGYGIEVARRLGVRLLGIDFSEVALGQARANAAQYLPDRAEFRFGTLRDTGLPAASVDALMCIDAIQFADPPIAAAREFRRLLRPGGRLAVTCWEATANADARVPARIRAVHLERDLIEAGFVDVQVADRPDWRAAERARCEEAVSIPEPSDAALRSLRLEAERSLSFFDSMRRVFATATTG